jgi:2-oxoglutarate dehydrogenase E1 component
MPDLREFTGPNAAYVLDLYERFQSDPASVGPDWQEYFRELRVPLAELAASRPDGRPPTLDTAGGLDVEAIVATRDLARSIRSRGHTAANLDPLGSPRDEDPVLQPEEHGISNDVLASLPASVVRAAPAGTRTALEAVERLREIYSGTIGYEFGHIPSTEERIWMREAIESGRFQQPLDGESQKALLRRLSQVEGFERFLHRAFFGQKRFSIEGTDLMVPVLDTLIGEAGNAGAHDVLIGMAHRGRLNVLAHVLEKPYEKMLAGFQSAQKSPAIAAAANPDEPSGDVKYHMGWEDEREFGGHSVRVTLAPNPSHLEFVDPVVIGMTRAAQDRTDDAGRPAVDHAAALAVLIHGDAAFPGQGIVAETFNMSGLPGYTVGGTIHIIANNQVGFTTNPAQSRTTRYSSDIAKGFEVPVVHVNADDAEACLAIARLAYAYRERFGKDFVIDLVGYRRWGHNEGDEPLFTQPRMYDVIRTHPTAREILAGRLVEAGVLSEADAEAMIREVQQQLAQVLDRLKADEHSVALPPPSGNGRIVPEVETTVDAEVLRTLNDAMLERPDGFTPNARLDKVLQRRSDALGPDGGIDWGHAEALAFASILRDGTPLRLTGQDVERGTFSHRHLMLSDAETGEKLDVLGLLPELRASHEIHNSPLSEMAIVGFEYGYSVSDPEVLVMWEAQFGDFANGAQVIIDQFIAAAERKWQQTSGLVLLLPHGYEGQGPEHSSARLERFLQLAAENNMRIANATTSAQYFHLLRRQAALLDRDPRPLVVMSPKSLLRHPMAASRLEDLASGGFKPVLRDDLFEARAKTATRLLLCSGKVYTDLRAADAAERTESAVIVRLEELYPFPDTEIEALLGELPALKEVVWVQEEPRNMGAWFFVDPRLRELLGDLPLRYLGRPDRASPAEGKPGLHAAEQARIVSTAWADTPAAARPERSKARRA